MANDLTMSPWVIDTESGSGFAPYSDNPLFVTQVDWIGYSAEGDVAIVKDWRNKVVFQFVGAPDKSTQTIMVPDGTYYYGLHAEALGGGKLLVYVA